MHKTAKGTRLRQDEWIYIEDIFENIVIIRYSISLVGIDFTIVL